MFCICFNDDSCSGSKGIGIERREMEKALQNQLCQHNFIFISGTFNIFYHSAGSTKILNCQKNVEVNLTFSFITVNLCLTAC